MNTLHNWEFYNIKGNLIYSLDEKSMVSGGNEESIELFLWQTDYIIQYSYIMGVNDFQKLFKKVKWSQ